jgi:drug/metabolite transporter (DMT)-like permease
LGDLLILISALNWAVFSVLSRGLLRNHPPARMMLFVMGAGWLFACILFFSGPGMGDIAHLTWRGWLAVLFLGIFCSGIAYICWYDALHALPASQVGAFLYIEPLVTLIVASVILGEAITWASILGGGVILLGVWMVNRASTRV